MINRAFILIVLLSTTACASYFGSKNESGVILLPDRTKPMWGGQQQGGEGGQEPDPNEVVTQQSEWIGIPEPAWGTYNPLDKTYRMYDAEPNRNPALTYYESPSGGYYTHYVDGNSPVASNTNNGGFGSVDLPRNTVPSTAPAGSIIEVHSADDVSFYHMSYDGNETYPIFLRGVGTAKMSDTFDFGNVHYTFVEDFLFNSCGVGIRYISDTASEGCDHVCIRNNELRGPGPDVFSMGARVNLGGTSAVPIDYVVVYNNEIHHWGDYRPTSYEQNPWNDGGGIHVGSYINYLWQLNNKIHHGGGDGTLLCHGANFTSGHIYIGGNEYYSCRENAVDVKECDNVVISQNHFHDFTRPIVDDSNPGAGAVVIHYGPENVTVMYNVIHDAGAGIESSGSKDLKIIGNVVYNMVDQDPRYIDSVIDTTHFVDANFTASVGNIITNATTQQSATISAYDDETNIVTLSTEITGMQEGDRYYSYAYPYSVYRTGFGIRWYSTSDVNVVGNTVYNCISGIGAELNVSTPTVIENNIVYDINDVDGYAITALYSPATSSEMNNNILYDNDTVRIRWNSSNYTSLAAFQSGTGKGAGCYQVDPNFTDIGSYDFTLTAGSYGIDTGKLSDAYADFEAEYGIGIYYDNDGVERPINTVDIGAYEQ